MKRIVFGLTLLACTVSLFGQNLTIGAEDVRIIQSPEGGYHLYIRKKSGISSVLLTETTRDPALKSPNYAYRAREWNAINGDEKRLLEGQFIAPEKKLWSLIDSTPSTDTPLGEAFHIWIPWVVVWGYEWSRQGETQVLDGTFINIRAFEKPYADYTGKFSDNPFRLRVTQKPLETAKPSDSRYMSDTVSAFSDLATDSSGAIKYARGADDIIPLVRELLVPAGNRHLDLVFVLDSTESMVDDIQKIREHIEVLLSEILPGYPSWRLALVLYKDYFDDFMVKTATSFTQDDQVFRKALHSFRVHGGRDIPEAVYEGLDAALLLPWLPDVDRKIILIGDAPPHPRPRGRIDANGVKAHARQKGVQMNVIILPHGSTY